MKIIGTTKLRGAANQLRIFETDAADPNDNWMFEKNADNLSIFHRDASGPTNTLQFQMVPKGETKLYHNATAIVRTSATGIEILPSCNVI